MHGATFATHNQIIDAVRPDHICKRRRTVAANVDAVERIINTQGGRRLECTVDRDKKIQCPIRPADDEVEEAALVLPVASRARRTEKRTARVAPAGGGKGGTGRQSKKRGT